MTKTTDHRRYRVPALRFACETCGAAVGEECVAASGRINYDPHKARYEAETAMNHDLRDHEQCRHCGGRNVVWSAASPLWNYVMRGNDINGEPLHGDLVCIPCFIQIAVDAGLPEHGWRLTLVPELEGLIYETPSGRVWDPERFLWVDKESA
jgi:hypothetical protein